VLDLGGEHLEFYCRDVLECIQSLYGDPQFAQDLVFAPERYYSDHTRTSRIYNEMHTGDWWWSVQVGYHDLEKRINTNVVTPGIRHPLRHIDRGLQ
jgi:Plavaka transposase